MLGSCDSSCVKKKFWKLNSKNFLLREVSRYFRILYRYDGNVTKSQILDTYLETMLWYAGYARVILKCKVIPDWIFWKTASQPKHCWQDFRTNFLTFECFCGILTENTRFDVIVVYPLFLCLFLFCLLLFWNIRICVQCLFP